MTERPVLVVPWAPRIIPIKGVDWSAFPSNDEDFITAHQTITAEASRNVVRFLHKNTEER